MTLSESTHWFSVHAGSLIIILGLIGELIAEFTRVSKNEKLKHKVIAISIILIVLGVSIDGHQTAKLDDEAAKAWLAAKQSEVKIGELTSTNLVLQAKVLKLEAKQNWRIISDKQNEIFIDSLISAPKSKLVSVYALSQTLEAETYASQIKKMLSMAGYPFNKARDEDEIFLGNSLSLNDATDASVFLVVATNTLNQVAPYIAYIKNAFNKADIPTDYMTGSGAMTPSTNELLIIITERR
jgi:hypothetical protein